MFNARQLMIFYFYGTCNQKATIIQFQKLKEKAKTEEPKKDIQDLIDFVAEYKDPDNYRWFFWESWLDIDMHRAEGEQLHRCNEKPVRGYGDGGYDGFVLSWLLSWLVIRLNI